MTEYNENKKSVSEQIVETIRSGGVKMRPKWHFALKTILALTGAVILLLTLIYIASFAIFMLRQTGVLFAPTFGFRGGYVFLRSLPWLLISLLVVFIVVLEILVRHYSRLSPASFVFGCRYRVSCDCRRICRRDHFFSRENVPVRRKRRAAFGRRFLSRIRTSALSKYS